MTRYAITHVTAYEYTESVSLCQNVAHLFIRECSRQQSEPSILSISPGPAVIEERVDYFGNPVHYFTIQEPHRELTVRVEHRIAVEPPLDIVPGATPAWERVRDRLGHDRAPDWFDAYQFVFDSRFAAADPRYAEFAAVSFTPGRSILDAALHLVNRIHTGFVYDPRATTVATPVAEVFEKRRGVCQDFAHLLLACLRSLGLAARYVSGYLSTLPPPGRPRLIGADATHAWVSLFCGDYGWVDLDPTNDQIPQERHILLAWGRDYDDVSPLKGVILGGGQHAIKVAVDVAVEDD
ncbi:Protein-glutamine gamma-glutamyltransferase [Gemmata sp. SH-PL17]|uniref:transglutaminase family protein n=1 Tax=Gemmata sp. SH-PL17 TaxID=1630693 RepID=UPI00078E1C3A|nr:transglutaminase family protein [Gemmata sp. SH-PL17]AMV25366.1 Protein-glutamine gamma-glutamyltransferase [Gemmata sp. SH-PL17]